VLNPLKAAVRPKNITSEKKGEMNTVEYFAAKQPSNEKSSESNPFSGGEREILAKKQEEKNMKD